MRSGSGAAHRSCSTTTMPSAEVLKIISGRSTNDGTDTFKVAWVSGAVRAALAPCGCALKM
jgi:hypothetical protein